MILGIGTDVVAVARVQHLAEATTSRFADRWFTVEELGYCRSKAHPERHLAARLAAKESVAKAMRLDLDRAVPYRDIEVVLDATGAPSIRLHGSLAREASDGARWHLSMSHSDDYATAVAVLEAATAESARARGAQALPERVSQSIEEYAQLRSSDALDPQLDAVRAAIMLEEVADVVLGEHEIDPESLRDAATMTDLIRAHRKDP